MREGADAGRLDPEPAFSREGDDQDSPPREQQLERSAVARSRRYIVGYIRKHARPLALLR